jgi:hypothetical protein
VAEDGDLPAAADAGALQQRRHRVDTGTQLGVGLWALADEGQGIARVEAPDRRIKHRRHRVGVFLGHESQPRGCCPSAGGPAGKA